MASGVECSAAVFVGIDVAQDELVLAERPSGRCWTVANDPATLPPGYGAAAARAHAGRVGSHRRL